MKNKHEIASKLHELKDKWQTKGMDLDPEPQAQLRAEIDILTWVLDTEHEGTDIGVWIDQGT